MNKRIVNLKFPKRFVFDKESAADIIKFFNILYRYRHKDIILDASETKEISECDLILLNATLEKIYVINSKDRIVNRVVIKGLKSKLLKIVRDHLQSDWSFSNDKSNKEKVRHLSLRGEDQVITNQLKFAMDNNPHVIRGIVDNLKRIGVKNFDEFYNILIEMVGNAMEHGLRDKHINWWLYQDRDSKTNSFTYTCLDLGVGILKTYEESHVLSFIDKYFTPKTQLALKALKGELGSSTGTAGRGTGLKIINNAVENKWIDNFVLITNNAYISYNSTTGCYELKKIPNFVGTYYTWTINKECFERWTQLTKS